MIFQIFTEIILIASFINEALVLIETHFTGRADFGKVTVSKHQKISKDYLISW